MSKLLLLVGVVLLAVSPARAQVAADSIAIRQAALDYIEGWYEADAERMARAVHPELAKRLVRTDRQSASSDIRQMGASELIMQTRRGGGKETPKERQRKDVRILDIFESTSSVRVDADSWIDYMHLAKADGRWQIVNVLWALRPSPK
ncbi:MAG TPA: nuclear transport factor 2 family protein [Longimicrobiaceae bacterium]|nr:nuclear transport factor 2 family protein [Longimicrobiaceae bacterium]